MIQKLFKKERHSSYIERETHPRIKRRHTLYIEEGTLHSEGPYWRVGTQRFHKAYYQVVLTPA